VILFAAWLNYTLENRLDSTWPHGDKLRATVRAVRAAGVSDVVLLGAFPVFDPFLPEAVYQYWRRHGRLPDRLAPAPRDYRATDAFLEKIAVEEGARFISLSAALCDERGCLVHTPRSPQDLLTWDSGHLTNTGADFLVRHLGLDRAPATVPR